MRSSQWYLIGFFLLAMGIWFNFLDNTWNDMCDISDTSPTVQADIVACVNGEIMDPFIWLLYPLAIVFFICAWIEGKAEKRK